MLFPNLIWYSFTFNLTIYFLLGAEEGKEDEANSTFMKKMKGEKNIYTDLSMNHATYRPLQI